MCINCDCGFVAPVQGNRCQTRGDIGLCCLMPVAHTGHPALTEVKVEELSLLFGMC